MAVPTPTYFTVRMIDNETMFASYLPLCTGGEAYTSAQFWDTNGGNPYLSAPVLPQTPQSYGANFFTDSGGTLLFNNDAFSFGVGLIDGAANTTATAAYAVWVGDGSVTYPAVPTGVRQSPEPPPSGTRSGSYVISWPEQAGVVGYKVYRKQASVNVGHLLAVVLSTPGVTIQTWTDPDIANLRFRNYFVTAFDANNRESRESYASAGLWATLGGTGAVLFGGQASLTATAVAHTATATATATATVTCTCHHLDYRGGHGPDCPMAFTGGAAAQVFTVAAPCAANNFAIAGRACQPFTMLGHACAPFAYSGGVQEGCECVTATATATPIPPPPVTAYLAATGTLTFGGSGGLTATATATATGTLFADTKFYAIYSSDNSLRRYDVPGSAWTTLIANIGSMTAANGKGAWDGRYYYFSGIASDRRLYRFNTATTAIEAVAGSAAMTDGSMVADDLTFASRGGVHNVYWVGSSAFGCYSVDNDSFTALPLPDTAFTYINRLAWDQGRYLYCLGNNNSALRHLLRWDLDSPGTWTQLSAPPALAGQPGDNGCTIIGSTLWNVVIGRSQIYRYDIDASAWSTAITLTTFGSQTMHSVDDLGDSASIVFERFNAWDTATQASFQLPATGLPVATPLAICYTHPFIW